MNNLAYISFLKIYDYPESVSNRARVFCLVFSPSLTPRCQRTITYNKEPLELCEDIRRDEILLTESRQWLLNQIPSILALDFLFEFNKVIGRTHVGEAWNLLCMRLAGVFVSQPTPTVF